jgi:transcription elongation factor GreA
MQTNPMTKDGATALMKELDNLKKRERPRLLQIISEVRVKGNVEVDREYQEARKKKEYVDDRIQELVSMLNNIKIIDVKLLPKSDKVMFGTTVHLINNTNDADYTYKIVGENEADVVKQKISFKSPLAQMIIGKYVGDLVEVDTPGGIAEYEILDVEYK